MASRMSAGIVTGIVFDMDLCIDVVDGSCRDR